MKSSNKDYVTVVTVENNDTTRTQPLPVIDKASPFVTVLSINATEACGTNKLTMSEVVVVHRAINERLGFGLKFQGGTKSNEPIQQLFIQSCTANSPASRVKASWGVLREGDEILEINGIDVRQLTRLQCVQNLKDSGDVIKLLVRNGNGQGRHDRNNAKTVSGKVELVPPPPPPVPPRKLNRRKSLEEASKKPQKLVDSTPPPDPEVYMNLFDDHEKSSMKGSESDADTASTLSTVIDRFSDRQSICSSMSLDSDYDLTKSTNFESLAKVLKPFQLLEKEFDIRSKNNDEAQTYEVLDIKPPKAVKQDYENVSLSSVTTQRSMVYENVEVKTPPKPLPRHQQPPKDVEPKKRTLIASVVPTPRTKSSVLNKSGSNLITEVNSIETWLNTSDMIHECPVAPPSEILKVLVNTGTSSFCPTPSKVRKNNQNKDPSHLPQVINVVPKVPVKPLEVPRTTGLIVDYSQLENEVFANFKNHKTVQAEVIFNDDLDVSINETCAQTGPCEAYFNLTRSPITLSTIGEADEDMSSLEYQPNIGSIVTVNTNLQQNEADINCTTDNTLFGDKKIDNSEINPSSEELNDKIIDNVMEHKNNESELMVAKTVSDVLSEVREENMAETISLDEVERIILGVESVNEENCTSDNNASILTETNSFKVAVGKKSIESVNVTEVDASGINTITDEVIVALSLLAVANAAVVPPLNGCGVPPCSNTTLLFPHLEVGYFWQCAPEAGCDAWKAVKMPCAAGLWFSYKEQVCVRCSEWENPCNLSPPPECECEAPGPGPEPTTERPTTIEQTETPPPPVNCEIPHCHNTSTLFPMADPNFYWQCAPEAGCDAWKPVKMPCPKGLWFSPKHQACVWCEQWENPCNLNPPPECECVQPEPTDNPSTIDGSETPPPPVNCEIPQCYNTSRLFPMSDPNFYWQCAPEAGCDAWKPVKMPCPAGLWFSPRYQACVWCEQWENPCNLNPPPECECVTPAPTQAPTTTDRPTTIEQTETPPPPENCEIPHCYNTTRLFPHTNPTRFWQCAPEVGCDAWKPVEKQCPAPLYFSAKYQVCDWCNDHSCKNGPNPAPKCI